MNDVSDIDASSILINGEVSPVLESVYGFVNHEEAYIIDHDGDGILERIVKFYRSDIQELFSESLGTEEIEITGEVSDIPFKGIDMIRIK